MKKQQIDFDMDVETDTDGTDEKNMAGDETGHINNTKEESTTNGAQSNGVLTKEHREKLKHLCRDFYYDDGQLYFWLANFQHEWSIPEKEFDRVANEVFHEVAEEQQREAESKAKENLVKQLTDKYGEPDTLGKQGQILKLQEPFFTELLKSRFEKILFEPNEGRFYFYDPKDGLFKEITTNALKQDALEMLVSVQKTWEGDKWKSIHKFNTDSFRTALVATLKGLVEEQGAFSRRRGLIHVANCMLLYNDKAGVFEQKEFSQDYRSRNASPFAYDPEAKCPTFLEKILGHVDPDDRELIQRYGGQCLLGDNMLQMILLLVGVGGSSKGAIVKIIKNITGEANARELRTKFLDSRFEIGMFAGKTLLIGADVKSDFLT